MPTDPQTREEWQDAADWAHFYLHLDSARQYGLVEGGPGVNVDRCQQILTVAAAQGIKPSRDSIKNCMNTLELLQLAARAEKELS